jgi:Holliday junction DNA helicase RuvA
LVSVTGIGPKVAQGMLSVASPTEIAAYLQSADEKGLTRLPGIGRKSAARLIVELSQRIPAELLASPAAAVAAPEAATGDSLLEEAKLVLVSMGLQPARAEQALLAVRSRDGSLTDDLERWIREALRAL